MPYCAAEVGSRRVQNGCAPRGSARAKLATHDAALARTRLDPNRSPCLLSRADPEGPVVSASLASESEYPSSRACGGTYPRAEEDEEALLSAEASSSTPSPLSRDSTPKLRNRRTRPARLATTGSGHLAPSLDAQRCAHRHSEA